MCKLIFKYEFWIFESFLQFNSNGQLHDVDIPDIFDVLDGTDDVKFLLGFNDDDDMDADVSGDADLDAEADIDEDDDDEDDDEGIPAENVVLENHRATENLIPTTKAETNVVVTTSSSLEKKKKISSGTDSHLTKEGKPRKRDPVDPSRCIYSCDNCDKAFTTKFNLKRHINLHCNKSKEAGVPIQGPPSASMPSRKARERREALAALKNGGNQGQII